MGRKKLLNPVTNGNFTTLALSPLGQLLNHIQDKLNTLIAENEKKREQPTLDKSYATQKLKDIRDILENTQNLLKYYDEGKEPSGFSLLPFFKNAISFYSQMHDAEEFNTSAYVFYTLVQKKLPQAIEHCKVKQFDSSNIAGFKENLKAVLKKQNYEQAKQIPGCNLEQYFITVDRAIDWFYIKNDSAFDSTALTQGLAGEINTALENEFYYKDLIISHPSMYMLIIEIMDLFEQLPSELKEIVPFLNPEAFNLDIKNSMAASVIPDRFAYLKVTVKHAPQSAPAPTEGQASEFYYEVTDSEEAKTSFSLDEVFREVRAGVETTLSRTLNNYFRDYAKTTHVKSEIAKAELLQEFTKIEKEMAESAIEKANRLKESFEPFQGCLKDVNKSDQKVDTLENQINVFNQSIKELGELLRRNQDYEQQNVATLFSPHLELSLDLQQRKESGLDTSYTATQLPEIIVARNQFNRFAVIPIKTALSIEPAKYGQIKQLLNFLEVKKEELVIQQKQEAQTWRNEVLSFHEANNILFDNTLSDYIKQARQLADNFEDNFAKLEIDVKLEAIAEQQASVFKSLEEAGAYLKSVRKLEKQMHASIDKTALASKLLFQIEPATPEAIQVSYQSSKNKIEQFHILMQNKIAALESRQKALDAQYNKAKAAKELAETMKSSDPTLIIELRESKIAELAVLTEKLKDQDQALLAKESQRVELVKLQQKLGSHLTSAQLDLGAQRLKCTEKQAELIETFKLFTKIDLQNILSNDKLNSQQGTKEAADYLKTFIIEKMQQFKELEDERVTNNKLAALKKAKDFIYNTKGKIEFETLDKEINKIFKRREGRGFDFLLDLIKNNYHTKERWTGHRGRKGE
jgi:hypothetical protein